MIREIRIYFALRVHLKHIARDWETLQMNFTVNSTIQLISTIAQTVNAFGGFVPQGKPQMYVAASLALLQGIVAALAQFRNPDGTSARVPYVPAGK